MPKGKCGEKGRVEIDIHTHGLCDTCRESFEKFMTQVMGTGLKLWTEQTERHVTGVLSASAENDEVTH